jgi:ABC-type sugar transport system permease subunit
MKERKHKLKDIFNLEAHESRLAFLLILPTVIAVLVVLFFPLVYSFFMSFTDTTANLKDFNFVWFANYIKAFKDPVLRNAFMVTIKFVFFGILLKVLLGIAIALMLKERFKGRGFVRGVMIIPWAIPSVVVGVIWRWLLNPRYGAVNRILDMTGVQTTNLNWLSNFKWALPAVISADVWQNIPFFIIIILAGLQVIPGDLYEAADIDGAGALKKFWFITLPMIKAPLLIVTILGTIFSINAFDLFWIMTRGGPADVTRAATLYTWQVAMKNYNTSYGSAISYLIMLLAIIVVFVYLRILGKRQL